MLFGTEATVTYNVNGQRRHQRRPANKSGQAMFGGGTWQVSDTDFCTLLTLENNGKTLPGC
jgi:hypothetical protein